MPKIETDSSNIDWAVKDGEKKMILEVLMS